MAASTSAFHFSIWADVERSDAQVILGGDLDVTTVGLLGAAVDACLDKRPAAIRLDLREVRFMDCAGTTELLQCRGRAQRRRVELGITHTSAAVDRMLSPGLRKALAGESAPPHSPGHRTLQCLPCGTRTPHVPGPTTRSDTGTVLVQWWSCTSCLDGTTVA